MTQPALPKTRQFQPGESGNPAGRPKTPDDILKVRKLNRVWVERMLNKHLEMTPAEAKEVIKDPSTSQMEVLVSSIVEKAIQTGDHTRLNFLLDRLIGRVKEEIEIKTPKPFIVTRASGEQIVMGAVDDTEQES